MKILEITSTFFPVIGGQEKVVYEISEGLAKKGHSVTILTTDLFSNEKNLAKEDNLNSIKIIRFKNKLFLGGYGYAPDAINWLKDNIMNYDVIHSHGYNRYLSEIAVKICKKFKKPCIFSPHGFIHTKKNYIFKIIHDLTIGKIIKNANICTALTQLDYKDYKRLGVKNEKIVDLPNGVHLEEFSKKNNKEILKFKKNFNLGNKNIISVGRLHKSKGLKYIIESIRNLDVNLIIVGKDAGYKKELEKLVEKLELKKHVIFTGPLEDKNLINAYKSCNLSVLFSEWEGFGIVAIESLAAGTPVIVSDRGALPYLIKNNENGIVVKFKDVDELKEKISELLNNNKKRENLIKNGKILAKKYSWENIVRKTEKIYSEQVKNAK